MPRTALHPSFALALALLVAGCESRRIPEPGSPEYAEAVSAFYAGLAAVQVGESGIAESAFVRLTELVPQEPAGWANLGVVSLQRRELEEAAERLEEARSLAPDNGRIELLAGLVARERGLAEEAASHLARAVELEPDDPRALYALARQEAEGEGSEEAAGRAIALVDWILAVHPGNLAALLERARLALRRGDTGALAETLARIGEAAPGPEVGRLLESVRAASAAGDARRAGTQLTFLHAELQRLPTYAAAEQALVVSPGLTELLLTGFVRLATPSAGAAPADTALTFAREALAAEGTTWSWVRALWLAEEAPAVLVGSDGRTLRVQEGPEERRTLPFPGDGAGGPLPAAAIAPLDYDFDFRVDLALAGRGGFRLLRQGDLGAFEDVTGAALPAGVAGGSYAGAWAADLDLEGDLDLVLARLTGAPLALRNRGDGTFEPVPVFETAAALRDFAWADLDADGDPDAATVDADGRLRVFLNGRDQALRFEERAVPTGTAGVRALTAADFDRDATLDLVLLQADGALRRLSLGAGGDWAGQELARWGALPAGEPGVERVFAADLDNNGAVDLLASAPGRSQGWLSTGSGLRALPPLEVAVTDLADLSDSGRLDLVGLAADGRPVRLRNRGTLGYTSTVIQPRAARAEGDRRINAFGVGGEVEVRAGLVYQKVPITGPVTHFGLGDREKVDVARIIWPNGSVQAEFDLPAGGGAVPTVQRLKGSCPWVFAWNGERMEFVTDFLWRTALGLRINAQGGSAVIHSEDWIRIRGDQLVPRDGFYDIRITAELWETHFFDHVSLMAVDHPEGTEVFVDERFTLPAPTPELRAVAPPRPVAGAWDEDGHDVSALVREIDERYLDTFDLGRYQGIAEDHYVEIALPGDAPASGPLWLLASGWIYPTDSSINSAVDQGTHERPRSLRLEVADGRGGWVVAVPDLGFPAGKTKTIMVDLEGVFRPGAPRRLRLGTNMEIYWDRIAWAAGLPGTQLATRRILPATADLRYRGFSEVRQAGRRAPELPDYGSIAGTAPRWRDLVGYHTRFGDIRPLNQSVDDRYVIMNAGDELVFRFPALAPPPAGWSRDFVLIGDGWVKDGDYNTGYSATVMPLPYHGMADYDRAPTTLEQDPAYRLHPEDWSLFHTRHVTPRQFHDALVPDRGR